MKTEFEQWLEKVDAEVQTETGVSIYDLPDYDYQEWYDEGMTPKKAAKRVVRYYRE